MNFGGVEFERSVAGMRLTSVLERRRANLARSGALTLLITALVAGSGCGRAPAEQQLRDAWSARRTALASLDSVALCRMLSHDSRERVVADFRRAGVEGVTICEAGFNEMFIVSAEEVVSRFRGSKLVKVRLRGAAAETVDTSKGEQRVRWVLERGAWRIRLPSRPDGRDR